MVVKVKHELPEHLVKEKIKQLLEMTVRKHDGFISAHEFTWNDDSCDIHLSAMKMQFKGNVVVHKDDIEVEVKVPLIFYGYQSKIRTVIEEELNKILK
jgi:Putative polyhydroxyalkanoic acid system protein (PHA_gran_rgn)